MKVEYIELTKQNFKILKEKMYEPQKVNMEDEYFLIFNLDANKFFTSVSEEQKIKKMAIKKAVIENYEKNNRDKVDRAILENIKKERAELVKEQILLNAKIGKITRKIKAIRRRINNII